MTILVTGASGYIGSQLVERLRSSGTAPRVAGRNPDKLRRRWPDLEAVALDALDAASCQPATKGVETAYYLIHSMAEGEQGFDQRDQIAARNFGEAAKRNGVGRVIYLGGLGQDGADLSEHLESRHATGRTLAEHGPPVVEFRASLVIGDGSASYRMLTDLVRRLPVMVTPRWVGTKTQPIAVADVIAYLAEAPRVALAGGHTIVEIGGVDVLSYGEMMSRYAALQGKRRLLIPVPLLTPRLSSLWCRLVTSVPGSIARPLIDGLRSETTVRADTAARLFPGIHPMGFDQAVRQAG